MPNDVLGDLDCAKIVITNCHALMLREKVDLSKDSRALLPGHGSELD